MKIELWSKLIWKCPLCSCMGKCMTHRVGITPHTIPIIFRLQAFWSKNFPCHIHRPIRTIYTRQVVALIMLGPGWHDLPRFATRAMPPSLWATRRLQHPRRDLECAKPLSFLGIWICSHPHLLKRWIQLFRRQSVYETHRTFDDDFDFLEISRIKFRVV